MVGGRAYHQRLSLSSECYWRRPTVQTVAPVLGRAGVEYLVTTGGDGAQSALLSGAAASNEAAIP